MEIASAPSDARCNYCRPTMHEANLVPAGTACPGGESTTLLSDFAPLPSVPDELSSDAQFFDQLLTHLLARFRTRSS